MNQTTATQKKARTERQRNAKKRDNRNETRENRDNGKAQITQRVAPKREPNVVKKVYKEGSPGWLRQQQGVTLTAVKSSINEMALRSVVMLDAFGQPTGEQYDEPFRDTAACTKRRRAYAGRGLICPSSKTSKQRRKNNRVHACNTKAARR